MFIAPCGQKNYLIGILYMYFVVYFFLLLRFDSISIPTYSFLKTIKVQFIKHISKQLYDILLILFFHTNRQKQQNSSSQSSKFVLFIIIIINYCYYYSITILFRQKKNEKEKEEKYKKCKL
jgi:hypothetical protein